jgi:exosortase D (VPLPA-CTERM-specific)
MLLILFGVALLLTGIAFSDSLEHIVSRWINEEEYGHAFFIPAISLWLLWQRRDAIVMSVGAPSYWGLLVVIFFTTIQVVNELSAIFVSLNLALLFIVTGLVLAAGGWSLLRVVAFPLALLVFAIPISYDLNAQISYGMQLLSSEIGVDLLRLVGISVYLEGNVIDLGAYKLQVVEACSGLNYLYPLLSLGFLAAYFFNAPLWQRIVVFLSAVPITILMNSARIAIIGVTVQRWGSAMAEGFLHFFEGWVIFMASALLLMGEIWIFARLSGRRVANVFGLPKIEPVASLRRNSEQALSVPLAGSAVALLAAVVVIGSASDRQETIPPRQSLATFPTVLGVWRAQERKLSSEVEEMLDMEDYFKAEFRHADGRSVGLYVAYYGSQRKGRLPHSPRVCIPGGGWHIRDLERGEPAQVPGEPPFSINRVVIQRGTDRQLAYYWFEQRGRRVANEYLNKLYLVPDSLFRKRTDGALVRFTTPVYEGEPIEMAEERLQSLMALVVPRLPEFVPK